MEFNIDGAKKVFKALLYAKIPLDKIKIIMAQSSFETGGFNDKKMYTLNNASGINFSGKANQKNAVKGTPLPPRESKTAHYAKFYSLNDWAVDHWRIVKKRFEGVNSIKEYATKIKQSNYFTGSLPNYIKGMEYYNKILINNKIFDENISSNKILLPVSILLITFAWLLFKK
jgi:hypothetical protein